MTSHDTSTQSSEPADGTQSGDEGDLRTTRRTYLLGISGLSLAGSNLAASARASTATDQTTSTGYGESGYGDGGYGGSGDGSSSPIDGISQSQFDAVLSDGSNTTLSDVRSAIDKWAGDRTIDGVELDLGELKKIIDWWINNSG